MIPKNISHLRFVKIRAGTKVAIERHWDKHTYSAEKIEEFIARGNNYGVICDKENGIGMIDADHKEYILAVENYLPETFSVRTSSDNKRHFYYKITGFPENKNKISLVDPDNPEDMKLQGGDIRMGNFYVVGPGSIHPDTKQPYLVVTDCPIAEVSFSEIDNLFHSYYKKGSIAVPGNVDRSNYPLPISRVLEFYGINMIKAGGDESYCSHPIHGSDNGTNFGVNAKKNVWCCRRCNSGGHVIDLVAVMEKFIDCKDSSSNLPDHVFDAVIEVIKTKFGVDLWHEKRLPLNDTYNAMLFERENISNLSFSSHLGGWLYYNSSYWEVDTLNKVKEFANNVYRIMNKRTPSWIPVINENDSEEAVEKKERIIRAWKNHVLKTGNKYSLEAMVDISKKDLSLPQEAFDSNKNLLCLKNGEYDLNTMSFYPFRPESRLTKQANYSYDPLAKCPNWERFLSIIFQGDEETIKYIQKCVGYSLTDDVSEQAFFILYGGGSNGKSTFVNTIRYGMGSYACTTPVSTLIEKKNEGIPNDVARLRSMRIVTTSETDYARPLDVATVKKLTSTEPISARFLNCEYFDFIPTFKIFLSTNHKPTIKGTDDGCWRRLKLIPFKHKFDGANKIINYESIYLFPEMPGIFNWALEGYKMYKKEGLKESKFILESIKEYKDEEDVIGIFLSENCTLDDKFENAVLRSELYQFYARIVEKEKGYPVGKKNFFEKLQSHGLIFSRATSGDHKDKYVCIGLTCNNNSLLGLGMSPPEVLKVSDIIKQSIGGGWVD